MTTPSAGPPTGPVGSPPPEAIRPEATTRAIQLQLALVGAGLLVTVLVVVFRQDLDDWTTGRDINPDSAKVSLSFVPVVIVLYIVIASLILTLISFLRGANNWARHSCAAVTAMIAIAIIAGLRTGPPTIFTVALVLGLLLCVAILFFLYHVDTTRWVHAASRRSGG